MIRKYGAYALIAGLAIAVLVGIFPDLEGNWVNVALLVLGLVGGALNVGSDRTAEFLMASIALMLAANIKGELADLTSIGDLVERVLDNVYLVTAAASLVLAVKTIVANARSSEK